MKYKLISPVIFLLDNKFLSVTQGHRQGGLRGLQPPPHQKKEREEKRERGGEGKRERKKKVKRGIGGLQGGRCPPRKA